MHVTLTFDEVYVCGPSLKNPFNSRTLTLREFSQYFAGLAFTTPVAVIMTAVDTEFHTVIPVCEPNTLVDALASHIVTWPSTSNSSKKIGGKGAEPRTVRPRLSNPLVRDGTISRPQLRVCPVGYRMTHHQPGNSANSQWPAAAATQPSFQQVLSVEGRPWRSYIKEKKKM